MASFVIEGGHSLSGDIYPQGAKNEVLQIICATLLTAEEVTVHNIPDILDVNNLIQLMRDMGVNVSKKGIDTYSFQAANVDFAYLESDEFLKRCSSLRGSVMLVGPMVARFGKAMISNRCFRSSFLCIFQHLFHFIDFAFIYHPEHFFHGIFLFFCGDLLYLLFRIAQSAPPPSIFLLQVLPYLPCPQRAGYPDNTQQLTTP